MKSSKGVIEKILKENIKVIQKEFWSQLRLIDIAGIIRAVIKRGFSPVDKGRRFDKYSKSYVDQIKKGYHDGKKRSPVSMFLTGKMLSTLVWKSQTGVLEATDEKWEFHNDGVPENNLPERRLLPNRDGELFNRTIQAKISNALMTASGKKLKRLIKVSFKFK